MGIRLSIVIVAFLPIVLCLSQGNLDSIVENLVSGELRDSSEFELIENLISQQYMRNKPDSALVLTNLMFERAKELGMTQYQARAKQLQGQVYDVKSSFTDALSSFNQAEELFDLANDERGRHSLLSRIADVYSKLNDYTRAFEYSDRSLRFHENNHDTLNIAWDYLGIGRIYLYKGDLQRSLEYGDRALNLFQDVDNPEGVARAMNYLGITHFSLGNSKEAIDYYQKSLAIHRRHENKQYTSYNLNNLGRVYKSLGDYDRALELFYEALDLKISIGDIWATSETLLRIGQTQQLLSNSNKAIEYCGRCLELTSPIREKQWRSETYQCLYQANRDLGRFSEAITYNELYLALADSIARDDADQKLQQMELDRKTLEAEIEQESRDAIAQQELEGQKLLRNFFIGGFVLMLVVTFLFLRQRNRVRKAYRDLKSTQSQLIQSEKMASLGEMTAGIAHEIQNPLNFINNFSEVNKELLEEIQEAVRTNDLKAIQELANDLIGNEEKITFHGKRADGIVKSMLQHSRGSSGQKEITDINALCDEYLRLAYHGLRARDKTFNADFKLDLDPTLPKVNVVPQDIGRVLLNLINNAFQACNAKQSSLASSQQPDASSSYNPEVTVTTRRVENKIEIRVKDNGNGIPKEIVDKIFQPFFTTKPTGHGTGLGLSMSYDIVKAHGGELNVETQEGIGTQMILSLPT